MKPPQIQFNPAKDQIEFNGKPVMTGDDARRLAAHSKPGSIRPAVGQRFAIHGQPRNGRIPLFAGAKPEKPRNWFTVKNEASSDCAEICLYDEIGEDWFGEGDSAKSFKAALDLIPKDRKILVRINSPGGNVWDGLAMYKLLRERKDHVTTQIDGIALSIASVVALGGGKVRIARAGQFMIHDPWTAIYVQGGEGDIEEEARKAVNSLKAAKKSISVAYVEATGKSEEDVADLMKAETWYVGEEAKTAGFVDEVSDDPAVANTFDLSGFKRVPDALRKMQNSAPRNGGHPSLMNREQILARLKKLGVNPKDNATDAELIQMLDGAVDAAQARANAAANAGAAGASAATNAEVNRIEALEKKYEAERKARVTKEIDGHIADRRLPAALREKYITRAMADETILEEVAAMPQNLPAEGISVECVSESINDVVNHAKTLGKNILASRDYAVIGDTNAAARIKNEMQKRSAFLRKNAVRIGQIWNANTVDATLKQDVIVDQVLKEFSRVLFPLARFSTLFSNVALKGNDTIQVPYLAIRSDASANDFSAGTGYDTVANTTNDNRPVVINKRKYLHIGHSSSELARQPFLFVQEQLQLLGQQLAYLVWKDVMSVVTAANYSAATGPAAGVASWPVAPGAMDSNKIADLKTIADTARFPMAGRLLLVNSLYDNALMKDNAFKLALNFGGTEVMREGRIPNVYGFDYYTNVFLPDNNENLAGFIAHKQSILIATAMIPPTEEVRRAGTLYSAAVDADTGIPLEYRSFGSNVLDTTQQGFECNYGYAKGDATALLRLPTA